MFVEPGATTLECSGASASPLEGVLAPRLREGVQAVYRPQVLTPLLNGLLATPEGRRVADLARASPLPIDLGGSVGEVATHPLLPHGALPALRPGPGGHREQVDRARRLLAAATSRDEVCAACVWRGAAQTGAGRCPFPRRGPGRGTAGALPQTKASARREPPRGSGGGSPDPARTRG